MNQYLDFYTASYEESQKQIDRAEELSGDIKVITVLFVHSLGNDLESFEDAVRNAVSLGGDTDTLAAITGSIAEAYFGIPAVLKAECRDRIDSEMNRVLDAFDEALGRNCGKPDERVQ